MPGRKYTYPDGKTITDDAGGHVYDGCPTQNRGPHFHDNDHKKHYDY